MIRVRKPGQTIKINCPNCEGTGHVDEEGQNKCSECGGTGKLNATVTGQ